MPQLSSSRFDASAEHFGRAFGGHDAAGEFVLGDLGLGRGLGRVVPAALHGGLELALAGELLLAVVLGDRARFEIRVFLDRDLGVDVVLDRGEQRALLGCDERPRDAARAGARGAPDAVDVELDVLGQVVVDDVRDVLDVDAAGREVGCNQHRELARAQSFHDGVALALAEVGVDRVRLDALAVEHAGELVDDALEPTEDKRERRLLVREQVPEELLLVPGLNGEVELLDETGRQ